MLSAAEKFPAVSTGLRPPRRRAQLRLARRWGPPTWHLAPAATRFKHEPETFESKEGERFLFQFGEGLRLYELPPKTRVIYPGVRSNGERDPEKIRERVRAAYDNPVGTKPLREKLRDLKAAKSSPKVVMAFDDVSVPLPPAQRPDLRQLIMEEAEAMCIEEGITDIKFICSIALHRFIRPDEFRELCGARLFEKYHPQGRMFNFNAVDKEFSTSLGKTRHGEDVLVCKEFVEADLCLYANVNFVAMDGGYKSYSTGMVHYECLRHNHDSQTLRQTNSLYDPNRSKMHKSFHRIGSMIQASTDIFHVETVVDDNMFPWYLSWVLKNDRRWNILERAVAQISCASMRLLPLQLRKWVFWSPLIRAPFGLLQINAGETTQVHARTLAENYLDKVVDVDGQADILLLAPTCIGPYTKDRYLNPLLVNTYTLGYYYNMYIEGTPLLRDGGVLIVPNEMHYKWDPQHANYKHFFENVVAKDGGLDDYEKYQEDYATNEEFNENYRTGYAPAGVHGFYMYSWAARGMDRVGKVYVVGSTDDRGPQALKWEQADTVLEAVERAKAFLGKPDAQVTYWRAPPIGYARLNGGTQAEAAAD